ncbi:OmpA family protein [Pseudomonas sp. F1_0610]|uniref:OmpA family protein n=1 Tax=Pseudomonas sp. F1_0610 TaxID=3114284 RepID=UPI0039C39723
MGFKKFFGILSFALLTACLGQKPVPIADAVKPLTPEEQKIWLDQYEPKIRQAVRGSDFVVTRMDRTLVVTASAKTMFHPDRPTMLMPVVLNPLTRVSKMLENDRSVGVIIFGHTDSTGSLDLNQKLSQDRARSVAAIFRLSGLGNDRMLLLGMADSKPINSQRNAKEREANRRVELVITPQRAMALALSEYRGRSPEVIAAGQTR